MNIYDIMTSEPTCCSPGDSITSVANLMKQNDCGLIPVVATNGHQNPIGVITDRDIVCRLVAEGKDLNGCTVGDAMTSTVITVEHAAPLENALNLMESNQLRRLIVVDDNGDVCGVISQADIARQASHTLTGEVVQSVSTPSSSSHVLH
ncbi:CBS domain-containing protein [Lujinxingia sediminis]|uniref:CBS domain-containing protein n=1 Tax=Lujinxingia sediminis TaxID=2480984 RepID=A0ABY0CNY3_9DELT|nr:CBS domain-containing protein [Lujinxingia sediminis]RVU41395.1 CBS domain-containing protein [Lujinxingia sediminis]